MFANIAGDPCSVVMNFPGEYLQSRYMKQKHSDLYVSDSSIYPAKPPELYQLDPPAGLQCANDRVVQIASSLTDPPLPILFSVLGRLLEQVTEP